MSTTRVAEAHGPERCHRRRCYAEPCKAETREIQNAHHRYKRRQQAYGRWQPFVDAGPVRDHVNFLRASGMGIEAIHELTGVSTRSLSVLVWGGGGRPPSRRVRPWTAAKILAVFPDPARMLPRARIDATGTRRRLQALQAIGWSQQALADEIETTQTVVSRVTRGEQTRVLASTAVHVRDLYDRLWDSPPVPRDGVERGAIERTRRAAAAQGWVPPLAWDDDTIDDPNAEPDGVGPARPGNATLPDNDELQWLIDMGETVAALAMRFGAEEDSVRARIQRMNAKRRAAA
jgi:hypothetical protein